MFLWAVVLTRVELVLALGPVHAPVREPAELPDVVRLV